MKSLAVHFNHSIGILFITLLIVTTCIYGSEKNAASNIVLKEAYHEFVDQIPTPVEGIAAIGSKLVYPRAAFLAGFEGKVIAKLYISQSGRVDAVDFIKKMGAGVESSIEKVLKNTKFTPAVFNGHPVKSVCVLTFKFEIKD